jgi:hypothetical protein
LLYLRVALRAAPVPAPIQRTQNPGRETADS